MLKLAIEQPRPSRLISLTHGTRAHNASFVCRVADTAVVDGTDLTLLSPRKWPALTLASLHRTNLSPFTKDFRGEGQLNESIDLFFPHPTLVGRYTTKKTVAIRSDATNNRSARLPTRRHQRRLAEHGSFRAVGQSWRCIVKTRRSTESGRSHWWKCAPPTMRASLKITHCQEMQRLLFVVRFVDSFVGLSL